MSWLSHILHFKISGGSYTSLTQNSIYGILVILVRSSTRNITVNINLLWIFQVNQYCLWNCVEVRKKVCRFPFSIDVFHFLFICWRETLWWEKIQQNMIHSKGGRYFYLFTAGYNRDYCVHIWIRADCPTIPIWKTWTVCKILRKDTFQ